ncbi:MAG: hypothetical protein F4X99_08485 [Gammaproteobacteria bacterium]|nr:hypothetical protein [Gammaproteobacteria bacterium]MYE80451.1 hypothetical protein [Gammaproteobacteria bacterium]
MTFLILLGVIAIAYFAWRVSDQIPDVIYRLGEIQRDVAELRRAVEAQSQPAEDADDAEDEATDDD